MIGRKNKDSEAFPTIQKSKRTHYGRYRFLGLGIAFLVILVNPFVNYYLHQNFIQGWYQSLGIGKLWFVSPLEGLESLLVSKSFYWPSVVGMVIPVLIALFLGRVFCSWLCPVSFILEILDRIRKAFTGKKYIANSLLIAKKILWFTLIAELVLSMVLGAPVFVFLSPPGLVGREIMMLVFFKTFAFEGGILILILFLELLTRRFFCRSFCPLGGLLAFIGRKRSLQVKVEDSNCTDCGLCIRVCPMGLNPQQGEGESAYCWNCGECLDSCYFDALHFAWKDK
ncbi:MAG: ferredoxin-type protein NapH [Desulforhopalus sp.]|jgi:ferredoxin-type protein NapH